MIAQGEISGLETGTVLTTEGAGATVIINKSKSCNECGKAQAGICGKGGTGMIMKVLNPFGAERGDTVLLGLDKKTHIKIYLLTYVLPVIVLFISAASGHIISLSSGIKGLDAAAGFTGLIISLIYCINKVRKIDRTTQLYITGILREPPDCKEFIGASPEEKDYLAAFSK
ncbi:MAG: SoxR reducing system RseC family protein [Nitrospirae bacterium]|nr:SoxR reducing system RseC family protein [Nitrospirota bacterium]